MIRRDYILRMIEEFAEKLALIRASKARQAWDDADGQLEEEFRRIVGEGLHRLLIMSEMELLARVLQSGPTHLARDKIFMLAALFQEAGDTAAAQDQLRDGRQCYLRALRLLLDPLAKPDDGERPEFVPRIEMLREALRDTLLPPEAQASLMQHYEQTGQFSKAEDCLFALYETDPENEAIVPFGIAFYERLAGQSEQALTAGGLPRAEVEEGLREFRQRQSKERSSS